MNYRKFRELFPELAKLPRYSDSKSVSHKMVTSRLIGVDVRARLESIGFKPDQSYRVGGKEITPIELTHYDRQKNPVFQCHMGLIIHWARNYAEVGKTLPPLQIF
jgi:hypothetical protein